MKNYATAAADILVRLSNYDLVLRQPWGRNHRKPTRVGLRDLFIRATRHKCERGLVPVLQDMRRLQAENVDVYFYLDEDEDFIPKPNNMWDFVYRIRPVFVFTDLTQATHFKLLWG